MLISSQIGQILTQRGIPESEWEQFVYPDFERDTHDPLLMLGMEKAVERLDTAIRNQELIGIFGDYDADGVPATALLVRCLTQLGAVVVPRIPTRAAGYGLSRESVALLKAENLSLLITIDNGTVAAAEIAELQQVGTDVIVCDHHDPQEGYLAHPYALLNPKQVGCPYPFKELCACAIGWKLMSALYARLGRDSRALRWELDLVGLSTIADMVPLLGENRVLAYYGLQVLRKSRNQGLQALAAVSGTELSKISAGGVSFRLAPRINAPSRMHHETVAGENAALQLLVTKDLHEAQELAGYLDNQNHERQELLEAHLREATLLAEESLTDLCLVVYRPDWSSGVIGLLAGRIAEQHGRPVVVLAREGGQIKGSVRSVDGVDAVSLLAAGEVLLERYGGHAKAGGLTMVSVDESKEKATVDHFRSLLSNWVANQGLSLADLADAARRNPDLSLPLADITLALVDELALLEPFGIGFMAPLFESVCQIQGARLVGREKHHLSMLLEQEGVKRKAIAFGMGNVEVQAGKRYIVDYSVDAEVWQGTRTPSCQVRRIVEDHG